jgi:hypothetical protein
MLNHVHAILGTRGRHARIVRRITDGMDPRVWHVKTEVPHGVGRRQEGLEHAHALPDTQVHHA